jgi:hypothetical protein
MGDSHNWIDGGQITDVMDENRRLWKCQNCGWELELSPDSQKPEPDKPFWRRLPGGEPELFTCKELIVCRIHES